MENSVEENNIVPVISSYKDLFMETRAIQTEIKNYKKRFESRIKEIRKNMTTLEKQLLQYMSENDHPGLRFQEIILLPAVKRRRRSASKKIPPESLQTIQNVLQRYDISPETKNEVLSALDNNNNTDEEESDEQIIKVKLWNKKTGGI